jgi:hypothetical protein
MSGIREIKNAHKNKEEILRTSALMLGSDLQYGGEQSDGQKADITEEVIGVPVQEGVEDWGARQ